MRHSIRVLALLFASIPAAVAHSNPVPPGNHSISGAPRPAPPRSTAEVHAGWAGFLDDATIEHFVIGGAARWNVTPRLALGPEVTYLRGPGHDRDVFVVGVLTWDLRGPCRSGCAVPYLVAAGGLMVHSDRFLGGTYTSSEGAVLGGAGVRVQLTPRFFIAPEFRIGWEPHTRLTLAGGWRF